MVAQTFSFVPGNQFRQCFGRHLPRAAIVGAFSKKAIELGRILCGGSNQCREAYSWSFPGQGERESL